MHRAIEPHPHHLRYATRVIAVRLVDLCLQHRPLLSRLNADHRQARFGENAVKPLRQGSGFQPNSLEAIDGVHPLGAENKDKPSREALRMEEKELAAGNVIQHPEGSLRWNAQLLLMRGDTPSIQQVADRLDGKPAQEQTVKC